MTSRTDDYHCKRCGQYMFSAYTVHMDKEERQALDKRAVCNKCRVTTPCTRSHPHELMSEECQRLTTRAREAAAARLAADNASPTNK